LASSSRTGWPRSGRRTSFSSSKTGAWCSKAPMITSSQLPACTRTFTRLNSRNNRPRASRLSLCVKLGSFERVSRRLPVPRTKMTRHQLKEQDEITTSLQSFTEIVVARKKEVTIGLTALAILVIAIFGWRYYSATRTANAETQLSQAINIYNDTANIKSDKERYERTIAEAQKTVDQYRSLPAGVIALYYVGLGE